MGRRAFLTTLCALASTLFATSAAEYVQRNITTTPGYRLLPGVQSVPGVVVVAPDQDWAGNDGYWNTFSLMVGSPQQNARVLVSTASQQIWVVNRAACVSNVTDAATGRIVALNQFNSDCENSRGYLYNQSISSSWRQKGYYQLWLEKKLMLGGNGLYGYESVGLGQAGERGPTVFNTTIGTIVTPNFWLGNFGLHPKPTNFSAFEDPVPSHMTHLFEQKNIPSLSFGYTAGSRYHGDIVLGSLTLGGYDASKIIPNDLTFIMSPDNERDLVVGVAGLSANTTDKTDINLLQRDGLTMFIDSTVAELYLPVEICKAFEDAFGLQYDSKTDLYLVNDTLHQSLLAQNPSFTFTLGQKQRTDASVRITLPYAALDLEASPPYRGLQRKTRYFPIRRGNGTDQWVLGRTFLQEAYLTVDWERHNFSVSAVDWTLGKERQLNAIVSPHYATVIGNSGRKNASPSTRMIIGLAVGVGLTIALILMAVGWWLWRRRHQHRLAAMKAQYEADVAAAAAKKRASDRIDEPPTSPTDNSEAGTGIFPKAELPGGSAQEKRTTLNEADSNECQIFEMLGDIPVLETQEAGGRQLSEKESMVVRERIYNGVDPNGIPEVSPTVTEPPRRLAPISPAEVTLVNGRLPSHSNVSPISSRTPRDGAFLETSDTSYQLPPYRPPQDSRAAEESLRSPISPLEGSADTSRRRFSYEA